MDKTRLAIVGCGVMGTRHLAGFVELTKAGLNKFELVAACDLDRERAETLAKTAEEQLGKKPAVFEKLEDMESVGVQAIDATTVPWSHHTVAAAALERGWSVMVEKPMGLTVRACKVMMEDAEKSSGVLYTAENFHYDPMNRIARELISNGTIGEPRLMMHNSVGGGNRIIVTTWRHYKRGGGPLLDVGVHNAYVTEYLMGEIEDVYAQARLHEKIRKNSDGTQQIEADAEDAAYATFLFRSGAACQYIEDHAGHGQGVRQRVVYGSKGSLDLPGDRTGNPITMNLDGKGSVKGEDILQYIPDFRLHGVTAALFGSEKLWHYELPFPETDRKLLAIEYADFAESILTGRPTEVKPINAVRAVAVVYAMLESHKLQRAVTVDEVMNEEISAYQDDINREIGLIH